jgi:hypothetical protein
MKYLKKFQTETEKLAFEEIRDYCPVIVATMDKNEVTYYDTAVYNINNMTNREIEELAAKLYQKYGNGDATSDEEFIVSHGGLSFKTNNIHIEEGAYFNTSNCLSTTRIYFHNTKSGGYIWYSCGEKVIGNGHLTASGHGGGSN